MLRKIFGRVSREKQHRCPRKKSNRNARSRLLSYERLERRDLLSTLVVGGTQAPSVYRDMNNAYGHTSGTYYTGQKDIPWTDNDQFLRQYVWFDLASLPTNAQVSSAKLTYDSAVTPNDSSGIQFTINIDLLKSSASSWYNLSDQAKWSSAVYADAGSGTNLWKGNTTCPGVGLGRTITFTDSTDPETIAAIEARSTSTLGIRFNWTEDDWRADGEGIVNIPLSTSDDWLATFSNTSLTIDYTPPAPTTPTNLTATAASSTQINLTWSDNSYNETGFKIEQKQGVGGTWLEFAPRAANTTNCSMATLQPNTTYYYRIRAYNSAGDSAYSNEAYATTPPVVTIPTAPTNLTATAASSTQINLAWSDNSNNDDGFKIERKTDVGGTWSQIDTVAVNTTSYQNTSLSVGTTYYYRVRAYGSAGDSSYSNEAYAATNTPSATIAGVIWDDADGDGIRDSGEASLSGWTVYLDANNNSTFDTGETSMTSDASGNYSFTLNAGAYNVRQVVQSNWQQTAPAGGGYAVTLTAGQNVTGKDFGVAPNGLQITITTPTISPDYVTSRNYVYLGGTTSAATTAVTWSNVTGGRSGTGSGVAPWSCRIDLDPGLNTIVITATDALGRMGTDTIVVTYDNQLQTDTFQADADASVLSGSPNGNYYSGNLVVGFNASLRREQAYVHFDFPGIPAGASFESASLQLRNYSGGSSQSIAIRVDRARDPWSETGICFNNRPAYNVTGANTQTIDDTSQYYTWDVTEIVRFWVDGADYNYGFHLSSPDAETALVTNERSFGSRDSIASHAPLLKISYRPESESPVIQITGPTAQDTFTTAQESIGLSGIASDNVGVTSVTWQNDTTGQRGTVSGTSNWNIADIALGYGTNQLTVMAQDAAGNTATDTLVVTRVDQILQTISGTIWNDADGDGVRDSGEPGVAGWEVFLDANNNGLRDAGEPSTLTASDNAASPQDETGSYTFAGLAPGVYTVAEVAHSGWKQTDPVGDLPLRIESAARAVLGGYKPGDGTPAPGGAVLSQANVVDGNPWGGGQGYRYLDGWNHSPRVLPEYYDGQGETAWTPGGHAGMGTTLDLWDALNASHPEWYAFDFAGYEYDRATFVTDSASSRYGHEDRWYDGSGGSWTLWDIRDVAHPVTIANGTLGSLYVDLDCGVRSGNPRTEGTSIITVAGGSALYQELVRRWGTPQLHLRLVNEGDFLIAENPFAAATNKWAIFGFQATLTPVRADTHTVVLDVGQATAGVDFGNADRPWHNAASPFDVDGQGVVSALDVLIVINYINVHPGQAALPSAPVQSHPFYDVNHDGQCTSLDVLMVINCINGGATSTAGEGEAATAIVVPVRSGAYPSATVGQSASVAVLPQTVNWRNVESVEEDAPTAAWGVASGAETNSSGDRGLARCSQAGKKLPRFDTDVFEIDTVLTDIAGDVARGWNPRP